MEYLEQSRIPIFLSPTLTISRCTINLAVSPFLGSSTTTHRATSKATISWGKDFRQIQILFCKINSQILYFFRSLNPRINHLFSQTQPQLLNRKQVDILICPDNPHHEEQEGNAEKNPKDLFV